MPEVYEVVTRAEDNSRMFAIYKKPNLLSREDERRLIFLSNNREVAEGLCDHFNYLAQLYLSTKEDYAIYKALHNFMCHKGKQ